VCLRPNACCAIETAHCAGKAHTSGNLRPLLAKRRVIAPLVLGGRSLCCWSGANFQFGRTCRSTRALYAGSIFVTLLISFIEFDIHKLSVVPKYYVTVLQKYIFPRARSTDPQPHSCGAKLTSVGKIRSSHI